MNAQVNRTLTSLDLSGAGGVAAICQALKVACGVTEGGRLMLAQVNRTLTSLDLDWIDDLDTGAAAAIGDLLKVALGCVGSMAMHRRTPDSPVSALWEALSALWAWQIYARRSRSVVDLTKAMHQCTVESHTHQPQP